jgi:hypothetical protein
MLVVSPFALQLTATAEEIVTAEGPVIIKSLPLAATELHFTGSAKISVREVGAHGGGITVPIDSGMTGLTVNVTTLPTGIGVPQLSSNVLPSAPFAAVTV